MYYTLPKSFASTYGSCNYGGDQYDQSGACTSATGGTNNSGGSAGGLANTGFDLVLAATLACVIMFSALVVRFVRKPKTTE